MGASWEGFVLEQVLRILKPPEAFFWATYQGLEIDLFFLHRGRCLGVEFKFNEAPKATKSMHAGMETLRLSHVSVIYPGKHKYPVDEKVTVWPLRDISSLPDQID